jgi:ABC-type uncharacterized transport system substrate-binding protein
MFDAIIVLTTPTAMAARNETKTIPIVHPAAINVVSTDLIASVAHPGGNVTGLAILNAETGELAGSGDKMLCDKQEKRGVRLR